ncbi:bacteriohemerythrin [Breznakiellaceae bacterium SP9]
MSRHDLVTWSNTFSVGVKIIDEQHKGLLDLVNDMFNHCVGNEAAEHAYFRTIIDSTVDYVRVHFATEEKIMLATKFSGFQEHKAKHDSFVLKVLDESSRFNDGHPFNLISFTRFLKDWLLTHVAVSDKRYFEYFKSIATRKADGHLSITPTDLQQRTVPIS